MLQTWLLLAALLSAQEAAPTGVRGIVVDDSGAAIAGATVAAEARDADCRTVSSDGGTFDLTCARPGDAIQVQARGFRLADVRATADPIRVVLAPSSYSESVVVTASRTDSARTSPAAPVAILTAADLAVDAARAIGRCAEDDAGLQPVPAHDLEVGESDHAGRWAAGSVGIRCEPGAGARRRHAAQRSLRRLGVLEPRPGRGHRSRRSRPRRGQRSLRRRCARRRRAGADAPAGATGGAGRTGRREPFDRPALALCRRRARTGGAARWPARSFRPTATFWCPSAGPWAHRHAGQQPVHERPRRSRICHLAGFQRGHRRRCIRRASRQRHA